MAQQTPVYRSVCAAHIMDDGNGFKLKLNHYEFDVDGNADANGNGQVDDANLVR